MRNDEPAWCVERPLGDRWVSLGYWPATDRGEVSALRYIAACAQHGCTVRLRMDPPRTLAGRGTGGG